MDWEGKAYIAYFYVYTRPFSFLDKNETTIFSFSDRVHEVFVFEADGQDIPKVIIVLVKKFYTDLTGKGTFLHFR